MDSPKKNWHVGFLTSQNDGVSLKELLTFSVLSLAVLLGAGAYLDAAERVFTFAERYEAYEVDEIIGAVLVLPLLSTAFFFLRNRRNRATVVETRRLAGAILDGIPDAVTVFDAEGTLVYLNPAARALTTPTAQGFADVHMLDLYPETLRKEVLPEALAHASRTGVWSGDLERRTRDGETYRSSDVLIAHKDDDGRAQYTTAIGRDLSRRVKLERLLQQKQKLEAIGELAGGIAHQYNNMLMVIAGHTRRALKLVQGATEVETLLRDALRTSDLAAEMTRDLLLFTRREPLKRYPVRVSRTLDDVRKLLTPLLDERYALRVDVEDADVRAATDASELVQAIMNLAINARDAMPGGGRIDVRLRSTVLDVPMKVSSADTLAAGEYVQISVKDTGTGIDAATLQQLFEPFFTTKQAGSGTGLGLPMVLGICQASGGSVDVESTPGSGATFHMYLSQTHEQPLAPVNDLAGDVAGKGETVLLVDDNDELREIITDLLVDLGYEVLAADGGFEAIEIEQSHAEKIDLLLTDVIMPGMSGPQVHRIIRDCRPDIQTLFISGYPGGQAGGTVEPVPEGATLLRKPVNPTDMARAIRSLLDGEAAAEDQHRD